MATPLWQHVRDGIVAAIVDGRWSPGARIPDEKALATEFGCARGTVHRALRELALSGVVERRRKGGTRVAAVPMRRMVGDIPVIRRDVESRGHRYDAHVLRRRCGTVPRAVRERLGLVSPVSGLRLSTLHSSDARPHLYEDRWVNPAAVPGVLTQSFASLSVNEWLVREVPYSGGRIGVEAIAASGGAARALALPDGAPVLQTRRVTWRGDEWITHVELVHRPGDSIELSLF